MLLAEVTNLSGQHFATAFNALMERKGTNQNQIHVQTGVDDGLLSKMSSGKQTPGPKTMERLATYFSPAEMAELQDALAKDLLEKKGLTKAIPADLAGKLKPARQIGQPEETAAGIELQPVTSLQMRRIPVFGDVSCGWGAEVEEHPIGWETLPDLATYGADHIVRVRGDSMADVGFGPDTLVMVKKAPKNWRKAVPAGKKVIARFKDDSTYTCKILKHVQAGNTTILLLQGAGPGFEEPVSEFQRAFEIVGVVVGSLRPE